MSAAALPPRMAAKIAEELCPVANLPGFCWTWTGTLNSRGYGCVSVNGKSQLAHRVAYELLVGPIAEGLQIDHLCVNKACCNPAHLEPVTGRVNVGRTDRVNKTRCVNGHPLTPENVIVRDRGTHIERNCRTCRNARQRSRYAKAKSGELAAIADMCGITLAELVDGARASA